MLQVTAALLESGNYRDFLKRVIESGSSRGRKLSFAELSRRAGFSSRSYPRDVLLGKKRITLRSLPKFEKALGLQGDLKTYFSLLVALEEPDVNYRNLSRMRIQQNLEKLRNRIIGGPPDKRESLGRHGSFYRDRNWVLIFSSLGGEDRGGTLDEIASKAKLSKPVCRRILGEMAECGLVTEDRAQGRFIPGSLHLILNHIGSDGFFKRVFLRSIWELARRAETSFEQEDRLFFHSVFSVRSHDLPELKKELRALLLRFVDASEKPEGDALVKLTTGLVPH